MKMNNYRREESDKMFNEGKTVNPEKPLCPKCKKPATHTSSHSVCVKWANSYVFIGWWSGWYCKNCNVIFCHHPACQLPYCVEAKKLQPEYVGVVW